MADEKRYIIMENVLNKINSKLIALNKEEMTCNNRIIKEITDQIITDMRKDSDFKFLYNRIFFGGSYYDGLKVGKPEEYDLDIVMIFPKEVVTELKLSNLHGFVESKIHIATTHEKFLFMQKLLDSDKNLSTEKVKSWMQGLIQTTLNSYLHEGNQYIFGFGNGMDRRLVYASLVAKGPAFTLHITDRDQLNIDVDLVPCFQFGKNYWPKENYRQNTTKKESFLIVPKKPHDKTKPNLINKYWRLSFQEQERELITGDLYGRLKPTIRLLKKLRDFKDHASIASYFIKTIFLWEVTDSKNMELWNKPLSVVFMTMLKKYGQMLKAGSIPYFWNENYNLLAHINKCTVEGFGNCILNIVGNIERNFDDPFCVAQYMMSPDDLRILRNEIMAAAN